MGAQENTTQSTTQETVEASEPVVEAAPEADHKDVGYKGNEDRKIFVGGIAYDVSNEDLSSHFSQYGEVSQAQVKYDRTTGRSRGFAFVEFATTESCKEALSQREQTIKNKQCEIKPAKSRENKKVFVGGLPADHPEEELRKHFEQYGKVDDIEWPYDKQTKTRRNFAFIVFEEEEAADRAASISKQVFGARECDVKKAVPQNKRNSFMPRGMLGGLRGAYGGNGIRGGPLNNATQWFNGTGWPNFQAGIPYTAAGGNNYSSSGGWGDWYGNAATAANYYAAAQSGGSGANFGAYSNGYDYSHGNGVASAPIGGRQPQNGSIGNGNSQRYSAQPPPQPQQF